MMEKAIDAHITQPAHQPEPPYHVLVQKIGRTIPLVGGIVCALLAGCEAAVTSKKFDGLATLGVSYSLPTALVSLTVTKTAGGLTVANSTTAPVVFVPDPKAHFNLEYRPNSFANDRMCVARSSSGLLNSVQFASDDATDEVLIKLAELAAKLAGPFEATVEPPAVPPVGTTTTIQFDPLDKADVIRTREILQNNQFGDLTFEIPEFQKIVDAGTPPAQCEGEAVCFREKVVTPLIVKNPSGNIVGQTYITVADKWNLGRIRINRPFLVDEVTKIGFDQSGFLTSLSIKRPSEVLAATTIPLDIIDTILSVPGNFLGRAFGSFAEKKQLLAEQKELAEARPPPPAQTTDTAFTLQCVAFKTDPPT